MALERCAARAIDRLLRPRGRAVGGHLGYRPHRGEYREPIDVTPSQGHRRRVPTVPVLDVSFAV